MIIALILVAVICTSAIVLREQLNEFKGYGYLGIFLICLLCSATVVAFIPAVPIIFSLAGVLPWYFVALVAGIGEALGEFVIYMAGRTGHAFFLRDRFIEAQNNKEARGIYPRLQRWVHSKGAWALFVASAVFNPFLSLISATAGATRFPAWKFFGSVWAGKTVKWAAISLLGYALLGKILLGLLRLLGLDL
ncbi:MAG: VTT domain-containing protein [Dehalococcoidia bacterium]|nr:VTT domain-containing protein [Dehalococcoidia bacterium]